MPWKKILRRDSLDLPDTMSEMFHHIAASMVISSCFACGMLVENTTETLVNSKNMHLWPAHFSSQFMTVSPVPSSSHFSSALAWGHSYGGSLLQAVNPTGCCFKINLFQCGQSTGCSFLQEISMGCRVDIFCIMVLHRLQGNTCSTLVLSQRRLEHLLPLLLLSPWCLRCCPPFLLSLLLWLLGIFALS